MKSNCVEAIKCKDGGKNLFSSSSTVTFPDCKPSGITVTGNIDADFKDYCSLIDCPWYKYDLTPDTYNVPASGCKLRNQIAVSGEMTIRGESGSYSELQSNPGSRHFTMHTTDNKLHLSFLKMTRGATGKFDFACIAMNTGILTINAVHFYLSAGKLAVRAESGGAITANCDSSCTSKSITITDSTFEGFGAELQGGAIFIGASHIIGAPNEASDVMATSMTIASTTFIDNWAGVSFYDRDVLSPLSFCAFNFQLSIDNFPFPLSHFHLIYFNNRMKVVLYTQRTHM